MTETWKPVKDWETLFSVSNLGRVRAHRRTIRVRDPLGRLGYRSYRERILKPGNGKYPHVSFTAPGRKRRCANVHDLVAAAFLGPKPKNLEICHNDGNGRNNSITNLRYDTRSANALDRHKHGTFNVAKGVDNVNSKLSKNQIDFIRKSGDQFTQRSLASLFNVSHSTIGSVMRRESYV